MTETPQAPPYTADISSVQNFQKMTSPSKLTASESSDLISQAVKPPAPINTSSLTKHDSLDPENNEHSPIGATDEKETTAQSSHRGFGYIVIDTPETIATCVDALLGLPNNPPSLYVDLEGINVSRHGSVSIMQIHVYGKSFTYLLDIHILGKAAFSTCGERNKTLQTILEDAAITKIFFDVRNDSDALHHHYGIKLSGIQDLQLMELATRFFSKKYVSGLKECIKQDLSLTKQEKRDWAIVKRRGSLLITPENGGSHQVFNERPFPEDVGRYAAMDVCLLPRLWIQYNMKLSTSELSMYWREKVACSSRDRIKQSQMTNYNGKGKHMALGLW